MSSAVEGAGGTYGGVAQLGEHLPCKQGVMGSNPIISITRKGDGVRALRKEKKKEDKERLPRNGLIAQQVRARA